MTQEKIQFAQVPIRTLPDQVFEALRKAIIFGQLPAGYRLIEEEIASQMGVSRAPVREALRLLEQEGLILSYPHRGKVVATIVDEELTLIYPVRAELEAFALRSIMRNGAGPELVAKLRQVNDRMRDADEQRDLLGGFEADRQFHSLIVSSSGYPTIHRIWNSLDGPSRARATANTNTFRDRGNRAACVGHQQVIEAISEGDCERAVEVLRRHIMENLDWAALTKLGRLDPSVCQYLPPEALK